MPNKPKKGGTAAPYKSSTGIISRLLGKGGEATPNELVDNPEVVNEFGNRTSLPTYIDENGQLTSNPFRSNYNFFDKLAGRSDQALDLNNQLLLNSLLGQQNGLQALDQAKALADIQTAAEISRRQQTDPMDVTKALNTFYAGQGISPTDQGRLSPLTAQNRAIGLEGSIQGGNILNSVLNDPANLEALKASSLARELAPIASLRKGLTEAVGPGEVIERNNLGVPSIDKFLGAMKGVGLTQEKGEEKINIGGKEIGIPTVRTVPGSIVRKASPESIRSVREDKSVQFPVPGQQRDFNPPLNTQLQGTQTPMSIGTPQFRGGKLEATLSPVKPPVDKAAEAAQALENIRKILAPYLQRY